MVLGCRAPGPGGLDGLDHRSCALGGIQLAGTPGVLEATGFRLVDEEGTARGLFGMRRGSPVVELLGPSWKRRVALTIFPEAVDATDPQTCGAWLRLFDEEGNETVSVYHIDGSQHGPRQGIEFRHGLPGKEPETACIHLGSNESFSEDGGLLGFNTRAGHSPGSWPDLRRAPRSPRAQCLGGRRRG